MPKLQKLVRTAKAFLSGLAEILIFFGYICPHNPFIGIENMRRTIVLLIYFIGYQLLAQAAAIVVQHYLHLEGDTATMVLVAASAAGSLLMGVHVVLMGDVPHHRRILSPGPAPLLPLCLLLMAAMGCCINYLTEQMHLPDHHEELVRQLMLSPLGIVSVTLIAPVVEELVFRGAIQNALLRQWRFPKAAIGVAALLFGLVHGNPAQIPFAFLTGLVLGWVYFRTGSLLPCILMHLLNNGSSVVLFHLTGQRMDLTMTEQLGPAGALWTAVGGAAVTALCLYLIHRQTAPQGIPPEKEHPKNIQA